MQCAYTILSVTYLAMRYFAQFSHKQHDFRRNVIEHKRHGVIFSTNFVWNISKTKNKWARYEKTCILIFMQSDRYSCQILMTLEFFFLQFSAKYSNIKFDKNPSSRRRVIPCGWTYRQDRKDENNIRFSQSYECASKNVMFQFIFYVGPFLSFYLNSW